jgi:hypothetical protein
MLTRVFSSNEGHDDAPQPYEDDTVDCASLQELP